jgi:hypothetical protein
MHRPSETIERRLLWFGRDPKKNGLFMLARDIDATHGVEVL